MTLSERFGTRHRAALGITEDTDAVAVVVSEESGQMSVVERARIVRVPSEAQLQRALCALLEAPAAPPGLSRRRGPGFRGRARGRFRIRTTPAPAETPASRGRRPAAQPPPRSADAASADADGDGGARRPRATPHDATRAATPPAAIAGPAGAPVARRGRHGATAVVARR